ncbi:MAG: hypothetical protein ABI824_19250 [Acidobacteriota bacterium]
MDNHCKESLPMTIEEVAMLRALQDKWRNVSPSVKRRFQSLRMKDVWAGRTAEERRQWKDKIAQGKRRPVARAAMSERMKQWWSAPGRKAEKSQRMREMWAVQPEHFLANRPPRNCNEEAEKG